MNAAVAPRPGPAAPGRLAVVGGGITGLAAARHAARAGHLVTLVEADARPGGKLAVGGVAGVPVDLGAEAILARRPEGTDLAVEVGLGDELVHPANTAAGVFSRGELHPLPGGQLMGVPGDLRALAASGILSGAALARARADRLLPRTPVEGDISVGDYVARRLGREVVDRLVEPLLGGVYAGHADRLSLAATMPRLMPIASAGTTLSTGVRDLIASGASGDGPVFAGIRGGVGRLPGAVAADAERCGARLRTGVAVKALVRTAGGWRLELSDGTSLDADAVLLAVPSPVAAELLAPHAPAARAQLDEIEYASVALVTAAFPRAAVGPDGLPGSGFLVPPVDHRLIKAATFSSAKWSWLDHAAGELVVLRASVGRHREEGDLDRDDADLAKAALADLADAVGLTAPPVETHVQRWPQALPQYAVGHLDRVARARAALPPSVAVAGAAYDGVGIPACIASAHAAVRRLSAVLEHAVAEHAAPEKEGHPQP